MSFLIFNTPPAKGQTSNITLQKQNILSVFATDQYFSNSENIAKAEVYYKSSLGNQKKTVQFNFADEPSLSSISFHERARSVFLFQRIVLFSKGGDKKELIRSKVQNVSSLDITMN